jgi:hypothetical protein
MRSLYLLGSVLLGVAAVFGIMEVVNYSYTPSVNLPENISYVELEVEDEEDEDEAQPKSAEVIYAKNGFDKLRGDEEVVPDDGEETPVVENKGTYEFEVRGIHIIGEKKMALITATALRRSRSSSIRGRTSSRAPVSSKSSPSKLVHEGEEIESTGYVVSAIDTGVVSIKDSAGAVQEIEFSLVNSASLKRAETAFKYEASRQKQFSKQNTLPSSTKKPVLTSKKPNAPTAKTPQQREAEMRKRAELLKSEMRRLKDIRDKANSTKESSKSKSKYDKFRKR